MKSFLWIVFISILIGTGASHASETALADLQKLFEDERTYYYNENPGTGPRGKVPPLAYKWSGVSAGDRARRIENLFAFQARLQDIRRDQLDETAQLNYDMFDYMINNAIIAHKYRTWRMPFYSDSGFHTYLDRSWQQISFKTKDDYLAYIARLNDLPRFFDEHIDNMRVGIQEGFVSPRIVLDGLLPTFSAPVVEKAEESGFYGPFKSVNPDLSPQNQLEIIALGTKAILESAIPAYKILYDFMRGEYYQEARSSIGISQVPGGRDYYTAMVRYYTTLDITADEVHALGLQEVKRIRAEMEAIIEGLGFEGSFQDFLTFLRTDPQFYATSDKELLMVASYLAKKADGKLPALFGHLPRQPYGVEAVPASLAPNYTTGRYVDAPLNAPRGGYYWVNTYALDKRPLYTLPSLTLHEAAPGHHLQGALSKELENVPEFRLSLYPHAFGEGWGLYSEKLGIEMGMYETAYEDFGRLTYEMWRALRLVVDTGMHMKGWSRERAMKLMQENSALSTHNIRTEIDRYIAWPGQALAYKMGELKILELRKRAKATLGANFDIRAFHDRVLSAGGVPLTILEQRVISWMESEQQKRDTEK